MPAEPSSTRPVLLTVSGSIPHDLDDDVAAGRRPRADYRAMSRAFDADVVDVDDAVRAAPYVGKILRRIGGAGLVVAWYCFRRRRRYDVIVTDGEQVGLPLAALTRVFGRSSARHMMIVHILSVPKKARLIRLLRLGPLVHSYVVYSSQQRDFIRDRLGVPASNILLTSFMVDSDFFDPARIDIEPRRMICSAGLERRDYPTMMAAVRDLDIDVVIAASSPWSRRDDSTRGQDIPDNVDVRRLTLSELRDVYAEASVVVVPLEPVDFQAGITTILEAMSMARPVVCTKTSGQNDTIVDNVTGRYVRPRDSVALREQIIELLDDPNERNRLGSAAREWVCSSADIEVYSQRLASEVRRLRGLGAGENGAKPSD